MGRKTNYLKKVIYVAILLVLISLHFRNTIVWGMDNNVYDCQMNSIYYCLKSAGFDMSKEYYISNPFYIQNNINNESMAFVFCDHLCVGEVLFSSEMKSCALLLEKCQDITDIFDNSIPIAVVRTDIDHIYVFRSDNEVEVCIYGYGENQISSDFKPQSFSRIILVQAISSEILNDDNSKSAIDESHYIDVPIQANATSPDTNKGLCWAACILSMLRNSGLTTITTTIDLYNALKTYFSPSIYGFPMGTSSWMLGTFVTFNYPLTDYDYNSGLNFNSVKSILNSEKPIYASLDYTDNSSTHAVIICGYSHFSNTGLTHYRYYRLMDPNVTTNYVTVTAPGTGTDFTYGSYTEWFRYFY